MVPWALLVTGVAVFLARRRLMALVAWLMPALGWLPGHLAKQAFPRERPGADLEPVVVYHDVMSFPSGHTGFATSISIFVLFVATMWGLRRAWMLIAAVLAVVVMALSRLYAAAHFPLDVLGGSLLAAGTSLMLWPAAAWAWTTAQARGWFWAGAS